MKLLRAKCPTCGGIVATRKDGSLREHYQQNHAMYGTGTAKLGQVPICFGSGRWGELLDETGSAPRSERS